MIISKSIRFTNNKIETIVMQIVKERTVISNLKYNQATGDDFGYIISKVTGKKLFVIDTSDQDVLISKITEDGEELGYIFITNSGKSYVYEINFDTGDIYKSSYLYIKQEDSLPILLVNEELETYKNIINYLKSEKTELVKDLFINMNGVFVNFLLMNENDVMP